MSEKEKAYWMGTSTTFKSICKAYAGVSAAFPVSVAYYTISTDLLMSLIIFNTAALLMMPFAVLNSMASLQLTAYTFKGSEYTGYINPKCRNLEVIRTEESGDTTYIYVRCKVGYLTKNGCPYNCQGFTSITGAGTFLGGILGGLLGLAGGPIGVLAGFILGGVGGTILEGQSQSPYEAKAYEVSREGKRIVIIPIIR